MILHYLGNFEKNDNYSKKFNQKIILIIVSIY